jgi:hypothetical protein
VDRRPSQDERRHDVGAADRRHRARAGGISRPLSFTRPLSGVLNITRAGRCKVTGQTRMPDGVRLVWSATLKGSGTCRS